MKGTGAVLILIISFCACFGVAFHVANIADERARELGEQKMALEAAHLEALAQETQAFGYLQATEVQLNSCRVELQEAQKLARPCPGPCNMDCRVMHDMWHGLLMCLDYTKRIKKILGRNESDATGRHDR
jgi:hypothetical protein